MDESITSDGRESSGRILEIAEREIGRIILDIHDGPVQNLFAALSQLSILQRSLQRLGADAGEDLERVRRCARLLEHSLDEIRTFMGTFRPPEFERRDLIAVLEGLAIQHEELTGNTVQVDTSGAVPEVSLPVKIGLYRILQEALSNASRHGRAGHHFVTVGGEGPRVAMEVRDDGVGFDVERVLGRRDGVHIGVEGMRERVALLGGSLSIESAPGSGTCVRVVVPCR